MATNDFVTELGEDGSLALANLDRFVDTVLSRYRDEEPVFDSDAAMLGLIHMALRASIADQSQMALLAARSLQRLSKALELTGE